MHEHSHSHEHSHEHSHKNILAAFLLNLFFSVFELVGGTITGSVSILSDSVHDLGDALIIGISYILEKKSAEAEKLGLEKKSRQLSLSGAIIATGVLGIGSIFCLIKAVIRLFNPQELNYNGILIMAVVGVIINFVAAYATHGHSSANEHAVSLHMLEDVLGWAAVLVGSIVMKFTGFALIDPLISIGISVFMLFEVFKMFREIKEEKCHLTSVPR